MESKVAQELMNKITFIQFMKLVRTMPLREWLKSLTENKFNNILASLFSLAALLYYLGVTSYCWEWWCRRISFYKFKNSSDENAMDEASKAGLIVDWNGSNLLHILSFLANKSWDLNSRLRKSIKTH